jgi:RNA polymerase sigma factor (sigma-70 family)
MTDEAQYRRYLDGDDGGLSALMEKYGSPLTLYISGYLHDPNEAEDLMIEIFAYLIAKRPRIRDGGLKAYLYQSARHMALRHKSKAHTRFHLGDLEDEPESKALLEEVIHTQELGRILRLCMEQLHPDYKEALYLTYFEDMSYAQAAEVLRKSEKQIANLVYRGKQRLRALLEQEGITNVDYP